MVGATTTCSLVRVSAPKGGVDPRSEDKRQRRLERNAREAAERRRAERRRRLRVTAVWMVSLLLFGAVVWYAARPDPESEAADGPSDRNPALVRRGRVSYEGTCAECHGLDLSGTDQGPPFLDRIYAPNHHSDDAFFLAVARGAAAHHWSFGDMPAQDVPEEEVGAIVAYVRSVQEQEGITEDPSHG